MSEFFDALVTFLNSDFAKENAWQIFGFALGLVVLTIVITSVVFNKLIIPIRFKKSDNIMPDYEKLLEENKKLKKEISQLKRTKDMINVANQEDEETEKIEKWEKQFLK